MTVKFFYSNEKIYAECCLPKYPCGCLSTYSLATPRSEGGSEGRLMPESLMSVMADVESKRSWIPRKCWEGLCVFPQRWRVVTDNLQILEKRTPKNSRLL